MRGGRYAERLNELQNRMITDTRIWLAPHGNLALCSREETEYIGLACGRCQSFTVKLCDLASVVIVGRCC